MKKLICMLLALCLMGGAYAEEFALPVLTAQLGASAQLVESTEQGDEYIQVFAVDGAVVTMGRFFGEKTAEELALMFEEEIRDGELLIEGENGIDERAMFLFDEPDGEHVLDATVIYLDGYTYGMAVVALADEYFGHVGEPFSAQVDAWAETLDVFDGEVAADEGNVTVMLLFDHPLYNEAELVASETYDESSYSMQLLYDGMVGVYEFVLPDVGVTDDLEGELLALAQRMHPDARELQWYQDDALTAQLAGYPAYIVDWAAGENEDTQACRALVVLGPQTLALAASVPVDAEERYMPEVEALFASAEIYAIEDDFDVSGVMAEEIGYALFGDYAELIYVWDETIGDIDYCVYEFYDDIGDIIGVVAVQPDTGEALVSYGADALDPVYEPVYFSDDLGYYTAPSVGTAARCRLAAAAGRRRLAVAV